MSRCEKFVDEDGNSEIDGGGSSTLLLTVTE